MIKQRHRKADAVSDIRYQEAFFFIHKMGWSERFWRWAHMRMFKLNASTTEAVLEGRGYPVSATRRFSYMVQSTEMYVPLLLCEQPTNAGVYEEPTYYVLSPTHRDSSLLSEQIDMVHEALLSPLPRIFQWTDIDKMAQLARAGSTARWVANKMMGKYDGEEN